MKCSLAFDPTEYDYGAASEAIRSILAHWVQIDWFEPPDREAEDGARLFGEHQRLARAQAPDLFPEDIELRTVTGDRDAFTSWCQRVRGQTAWDWKFSILKALSSRHANAHA